MAIIPALTAAEAVSAKTAFSALGVCDELCDACVNMRWKEPTPIQIQAIPELMKGAFLCTIMRVRGCLNL